MFKFLFKNKVNVELTIKQYNLNLRSSFGTAHSVTTTRNNALIEIKVNDIRGFGECGLPSKKPFCYLADFNDIKTYFNNWIKEIDEKQKSISTMNNDQPYQYNAFNKLPNEYFTSLRGEQQNEIDQTYQFLLECLDNCKDNTKEYSNQAKSAIEMAILDGWGKKLNCPIYKLLDESSNVPPSSDKPFYYTISMCPTMEEILESTKFGSGYTSFLKIKLDGDIEKGMNIITTVINYLKDDLKRPISKISVDANTSWTPLIARLYLEKLKPFAHLISMVEQPFPIQVLKRLPNEQYNQDYDLNEWKSIKSEYQQNGLLIFADESVCTENDLCDLVDLVHGVNVKIEKTGGIRSAITTLINAKQMGLKTWIGCMVSSSLDVSAAAHILCTLSDYGGDLDGGLLVDDETQLFENDAFQLINGGLIKLNQNNFGVGVTLKK